MTKGKQEADPGEGATSDVKLFRISGESIHELEGRASVAGTPIPAPQSLQGLVEGNLERFLHVRLVASEHSTARPTGPRP